MDFSDLFDFGHRVTKDTTMVKTVDDKEVTKRVRGSFNWLGGIFSLFYAIFSTKYKTKGFVGKMAVPFVIMIIVNLILELILGSLGSLIAGVADVAWVGLMFDTWFQHQLIANGYREQTADQSTTAASTSTSDQDFE